MAKEPIAPFDDRWIDAFRISGIDGLAGWVINEDRVVCDATHDVADAAGHPLADYMGMDSRATSIQDQLGHPSHEVRQARQDRLFAEGGAETMLCTDNLADRGWTSYLVTSLRIMLDDGTKYLLNVAHDVSQVDTFAAAFNTPALQGLIAFFVDSDGKCLAASQGAARFIGAPDARDLVGVSIVDTEYSDLALRERERVTASQVSGEPAEDVEWLESGEGRFVPFAIARVALPEGRWLVVMIRISLDMPHLQKPLGVVLKGKNFAQPRVTAGQFDTLVDMAAGLSPSEAAARRGNTEGSINQYRNILTHKVFKVGYPRRVLGALHGTALGSLVHLYAQQIDLDAYWEADPREDARKAKAKAKKKAKPKAKPKKNKSK
jgi:PAS domain-containing protein